MPLVGIAVTTMVKSGDFAAPTLTCNVGIIRTERERIRLELELTCPTLALVAGRAERRTKLVGRPREWGGRPDSVLSSPKARKSGFRCALDCGTVVRDGGARIGRMARETDVKAGDPPGRASMKWSATTGHDRTGTIHRHHLRTHRAQPAD
jgi:hypothetical protein